MLLNNQDIEGRNLIAGAVAANYQPAGYDVSIAEIVDADGRKVAGQTHRLPPQGIAWAISTETVTLPDDILGYATIRTTLCNEGILALNIGIVDPGWSGPISTAFINFGKDDFILEKGEKFLRLTFHEMESTPSIQRPVVKSADKYASEVRQRARHHFGKTFLNLDSQLAREQRRAAIRNFPVYGFAAALFTIALTIIALGFSYFATWRAPNDIRQTLENSNTLASRLIESRDERIRLLEAALKPLECDRARVGESNDYDPALLSVATVADCRAENAP